MARNNVSRKIKIEKIIQTVFDINKLISFKLIQSDEKNFTSSTVLALLTIKPINEPPIIRITTRLIARKLIIAQREAFLFFLLIGTFSFFFSLISIFSQNAEGAVLETILYEFSSYGIIPFHSCET